MYICILFHSRKGAGAQYAHNWRELVNWGKAKVRFQKVNICPYSNTPVITLKCEKEKLAIGFFFQLQKSHLGVLIPGDGQ